jgi:GNAT superfamily N-acetyltransferase
VSDPVGVTVSPHSSRPIPAHQVLELYRAQQWWADRTADQVAEALDRGPAVGAWHGDQLVGFVRAVTDGVVRAYLEDVLVAESHRGVGVGRALVATILDLVEPIPVVSLFCSTDLAGYYEAAGFYRTDQVVLHRR